MSFQIRLRGTEGSSFKGTGYIPFAQYDNDRLFDIYSLIIET